MHRHAVVLLLLLAGAGACDPGSSGHGGSGEIDAALSALFDSTFLDVGEDAGAMLRVEAPTGGLVWERARGLADPGGGSDLVPQHTVRIASITKSYVAAAVLRMVEEGAVALDDPVEPHLGPATVRLLREGGYDPSAVTVRMLLQHTSGLTDYATADAFVERVRSDPQHRWNREEQLAVAVDVGGPVAPPGARFHYSDTGYVLLGEILERGTGGPLRQALRELLSFDALGLEATWLESAEPPPPGAPPRAHQRWSDPQWGTLDTYDWDPSFDLFGGGGLVSNPEEVITFFRALFEGEVFHDPTSLDAMTAATPQSLLVTEEGYGMGLGRGRYQGVECFGHGGFWGTLVRYCPEAELAVAGVVTSTADRERLEALVRRTLTMMTTEAIPEADAPGARAPSPRETAAEGEDPLGAELEAMIPPRMRSDGVPGLTVLVLRRGEVRWLASFGVADLESGRPMTPDAVFRVESISKPVTAWGILMLAEEGLLDLDEPVQSQLGSWSLPPEFPPFTPRQLLSHTAGLGLGDYGARYPPNGTRPSLGESLEAELAMVGPPGGGFSYSDTGYNLLELLLQDRTGVDFGRWMDEELLSPLGMVDARFDWEPWIRGRIPTAHTLRGGPVEPYVYPGRGSGGLFASARDVGRFVAAGADPGARRESDAWEDPGGPTGPLLADSSIALLHTPVARLGGLYGIVAEGYGLGHFTETLSDGRSAVWHGGQGYGWMTHFHLVPETGDGIVLLANSQRAWPLFAHTLRAWSASLGVDPVRMSRITWAAPLAWIVIGLSLGAAVLLVVGTLVGRRGRRRLASGGCPRPQRTAVRVSGVLAGVVAVGTVGWAATRDYLFLFSILPSATGWLGASTGALGLALIAWSTLSGRAAGPSAQTPSPGDPPPGPGSGLVVPLLVSALALPAAGPARAQERLAHLEGGWMPPSDVTRSLSGPATEARVSPARGSVLIPLVWRRRASSSSVVWRSRMPSAHSSTTGLSPGAPDRLQ